MVSPAKRSLQSQYPAPANDLSAPQPATRIPWWVTTIVILGAVLTLTGAVISKVAPVILTNNTSMNDAARVYADYLFARDLPLALMLLFLLVIRARRMLAGFMVLTALIQIVDVTNDLIRGDYALVPGLLVFAIVFLLGAWSLFGQALWHVAVWRDRPTQTPGDMLN